MQPDFNITIAGLGLIGGSYAMALQQLNPRNLWAVDIDQKTLAYGKEMKIISEGYTPDKARIPLEKSDLVIISLYPGLAVDFIRNNHNYFKSGSVITDTAGVKKQVLNQIQTFLRDDVDFVGGHPLAGKESSGLTYASPDIFCDTSYIITPTAKNKSESIKLIETLAIQIGCKTVARVSPAKHDELIALTSQLPHVMAVSLVNSACSLDLRYFVGGSFKDMSRVARINSTLWTELMLENRLNLLQQMELLEKQLTEIKGFLQNENYASLKDFLEKANKQTRKLLTSKQDIENQHEIGLK